MIKGSTYRKLFFSEIDLPFLLFIIGATYVKAYIKIASILLYFIFIVVKKITFPGKITGVVKFYLLIPLIGLITPLLSNLFTTNTYIYGYLFGTVQWLICAATFYLIFAAINNIDKNKITRTIEVFFVINALATLLQLIMVMVSSRSFMPYWESDPTGKFGVSTGDHLYGIFGNSSINNAAISIIGCIYFLYHKNIFLATTCILIMLFCTSNTSLIITLITFCLMFVFIKNNYIRKYILLLTGIMIIFYPILSSANLLYVQNIYKTFVLQVPTNYQNPDSIEVLGGRNPNIAAANQENINNINAAYIIGENIYKIPLAQNINNDYIYELKNLKSSSDQYKQNNSVVNIEQSRLKNSFLRIYGIPVENSPLSFYAKPGKLYSFIQTYTFLKSSYRNLFFGAGMGNFSSKLAIKMTGLGIQGKYPSKYVYVSSSFLQYHLYTIFYYLCQNIGLHSVLNMPNSVYNQMAGEYGIIGLAAFIVLYIGFFWKKRNKYGYGQYLLFVLLLFFNMDYWYEMASFTVIFELLMLTDIFAYPNNNANKPTTDNGVNAGI